MLADNFFAQVLDANLQIATAGRALLNEIGSIGHDGISFHRFAQKKEER